MVLDKGEKVAGELKLVFNLYSASLGWSVNLKNIGISLDLSFFYFVLIVRQLNKFLTVITICLT